MADYEDDMDRDVDLEDLGDPVEELLELEESPSSAFRIRLLDALRRRDLSSQMATLGWTGLAFVLREFLMMVYTLFDSDSRDRGGTG